MPRMSACRRRAWRNQPAVKSLSRIPPSYSALISRGVVSPSPLTRAEWIPNGILDSRIQRFTPASSLHLPGMSYPDRGIEIDAAAA